MCLCKKECEAKLASKVKDIESKFEYTGLLNADKFCIKLYTSVQRAFHGCGLEDNEKNMIMKIIRAKYKADMDSRPLGPAIWGGFVAILMGFMSIIFSLAKGIDAQTISSLMTCLEYTIYGLLIAGFGQLVYSMRNQEKCSIIISAIDDMIAEAEQKQ